MQVDALLPMLIQAGCATQIGKDIFQDFMPASVNQGILLLSPLGGNPIDWELSQNWRVHDRFQLIVRAVTRAAGMTIALSATRALTQTCAFVLPALNTAPQMNMQYMRPIAEPIPYPRQTDKLWEISTNFEASYSLSPANVV